MSDLQFSILVFKTSWAQSLNKHIARLLTTMCLTYPSVNLRDKHTDRLLYTATMEKE